MRHGKKWQWGEAEVGFRNYHRSGKPTHGNRRDRFTKDLIQNLPVEFEGAHRDPWRKEDVRITYRQKVYGIK